MTYARLSGPTGTRGRSRALALDLRRIRVQPHHRGPAGREPLRQARLRQQHPRGRVLQHVRQALRGVRRVQRDVGRARLEDPQHRDHHLRTALQAQPHARVRTHAQPAEVARQPVGPLVQLPVGELAALEDHGHGGRRAIRLRLEQLVDAALRADTPRPWRSTPPPPAAAPPPPSAPACERRTSASAATPSRTRCRCPSIRRIVPRSKRSVLYSSAAVRPSRLPDHEQRQVELARLADRRAHAPQLEAPRSAFGGVARPGARTSPGTAASGSATLPAAARRPAARTGAPGARRRPASSPAPAAAARGSRDLRRGPYAAPAC